MQVQADHAGSNRLKGKVSLFSASSIVIANMIGAGIFTTSGLLMEGLGQPVLLIGLWMLGGIIALCGALAYAELGAAMPKAGGEYVFLSQLYHPLFGFLSGWVSFLVGFTAPIAASSIGFSEYFLRAFPAFQGFGKPLAVLVIVVFTLVHLRGLQFGAAVQNVLTVMKVGMIILLIFLCFTLGKGTLQHFSQGSAFDWNFSGFKSIGLSLLWIMFAYSGWNASTYIGSEIRDPTRNIPRSLMLGTAAVLVLYVLLNLVYIYAVTPGEMKGVISVGGLAIRNAFGSAMEITFSLLIAFALFSSLSAFIILGPRVYYAMAADGYFFKFVSRIHPRYHVPYAAIILQAAIAILMVLSGTFDQILTYMGFALGFFPILAVVGVFKLRLTDKARLRLRGYPFFLIFYLFFAVVILVLSFLERPVESSIALLTVVLGIPVYLYFKRIIRR
jgi:basic amino acid/polyamine antiporter, APA family